MLYTYLSQLIYIFLIFRINSNVHIANGF